MLQGAERRFVRSLALLEAAWETSVLGVGARLAHCAKRPVQSGATMYATVHGTAKPLQSHQMLLTVSRQWMTWRWTTNQWMPKSMFNSTGHRINHSGTWATQLQVSLFQ